LKIIYPVHPNPNVTEPARRLLADCPGVRLLPPLDYVSFVHLLKRCRLVLSDSGGVQEEAPALHKPVLVLRDKTERPEAIRAGTARIVGTDPERIITETLRLVNSTRAYRSMTASRNPFGDGKASARIADFLEHEYGFRTRPAREFTV
jgi:UDP-N-acetylglucosamine 2-epimerase (non-hydrolysing)